MIDRDYAHREPDRVTYVDIALALIALVGVFFWVVLLLAMGGYNA